MTEELIETIRVAIASDATAEARAAGVTACRTIVAALGSTAGEPLALAPASTQPGPVATAIATMLRSTPPDELLDMAIGKLRALVPDASTSAIPKLSFQFVKVPRP